MSNDSCQTNNSMIVPNVAGESTVEALEGWIKRRLGFPTIAIELTSDQIYDAIQEALIKFVSVAERPVRYYQIWTIANVNTYPLPADFVGMHQEEFYYIPDTIVNFIQTFTSYQMYVNFTGNLDITNYNAIMQNLQLKINMIGAKPNYEIITNPPRIKVYPAPSVSGSAIVFSYFALPKIEDWTPQQDLVGFNWVREYALAICKRVLGRIRNRFGDAVTLGDGTVTQDGATLLTEATTDIKELEEKLELQRRPLGISLW